eukprot:CAMPEP_0202902296 /NCGR_PEP_ID=MMETSP1392-20130828/16775_1 /ASSEMBLY_ACC=CAM_ASM_000868 /TAXON_ID=225041 /ORGANISM="Chlamydomonas chlamydogama, Strain SAG 11-48b" /LENGTH=215 /DNA_ID=CAMNT_0049589043 /DNA_START=201 /DNA_END=845 /DNA_ORIENTATION=+
MGQGRDWQKASLLALVLVLQLAFLPHLGLAQEDEDASGVAALSVFPYCRCDDYRCGAGPYKIVPSSVTQLSATVTRMCFRFMFVGCAINSDCCRTMVNDLFKVEFSTDKVCANSVVNTTLNGFTKKGSTYFKTEFATGVLSITKLDLNGQANISAAELCIFAQSPCNTYETLFDNRDGTYKYSTFNEKLNCCPICIQPDRPPPPPLPPSPSPPFA